jgi:large subunit ribosomal protein L20
VSGSGFGAQAPAGSISASPGTKEDAPMRVKRGLAGHRRHKKYLDLAKGYRSGRSRLYRTAREAVERAMAYATRDRKVRKREFRKLWILRINAGAREHGLSYSRFMNGLQSAGVELNRKMLADMAVSAKEDFARLVELAKSTLA